MKKNGFTLAEVLITLGIVGVISAMVIPTFTTRMQTAKIGPKLAKAKAAFEQATIAILDDAQSDSLSGVQDGAVVGDSGAFYNLLATHMKGSSVSTTTGEGEEAVTTTTGFTSADGASYAVNSWGSAGNSRMPHMRQVASEVMIDINGDLEPNRDARDRFYFRMMDDGSLKPFGEGGAWRTSCAPDSVPGNLKDCTGHVLENGLRVDYR